MTGDKVPAIPASCAGRPTVGGLVAPYVNIMLADGGVDFRTPDQKRFARCWTHDLCQTCGEPLGPTTVLFGGPHQIAERMFDEPPLCPPCALYASQACPMVAGRQPHYTDRARLAETKRGHTCPAASCSCGGFVTVDPDVIGPAGQPAHTWYAAYVRTCAWQVTAHYVETPCSDGGCDQLHTRLVVNGCQLTEPPRKIVLVSTQEHGRVWQRHHGDPEAASCAMNTRTPPTSS